MLQYLLQINPILYYFGWFSFLGFLFCLVFLFVKETKVLGVNAYLKPAKFFLSSGIFAWTMAWYMYALSQDMQNRVVNAYSLAVVGILGFETIYIFIQAHRGQLSHFNISSPFHGIMYSLMGIAISILTIWTAYIAYLFFQISPNVYFPLSYLWGIRLGIIFFVIFAFEGGIMGGRMTHTVGGEQGGKGIPFLNWSTEFGDLRIAHFIGMHALQILPLIGFYIIHSLPILIIFSIGYFLFTLFLTIQALRGKPILLT